jgi:hypothetical protein
MSAPRARKKLLMACTALVTSSTTYVIRLSRPSPMSTIRLIVHCFTSDAQVEATKSRPVVGSDGIRGTAGDEDIDFRTDTDSLVEGFTGEENTLNVSAWAFVGGGCGRRLR